MVECWMVLRPVVGIVVFAGAPMIFDYAATHPDAIITCKASGHYFLSSDGTNPPNNGAVSNVAKVIKAAMSSAAEAELGAHELALEYFRCT